jgi:phosphoesterase RecJ-like protein
MELSPKQQVNELIKNSQKILITGHSDLGGDCLGGMLALQKVLIRLGKEAVVVASDIIDKNLQFLPGIDKVNKDITGTRDIVIRIDTEKTPIEKISYDKEDNYLNIHITPKNGQLQQSDVGFSQGSFQYDLIFVLDTPGVEKIDSVYSRYSELFFETPIVNIDHHSGNEYFGTVNFVDLTATSTCEILVSIIESFGPGNFDEDVATCLLTGIVADTASFKNTNTTPKSLTISAQMLAAGARQQEVIKNLYKQKSLPTLKLWGQVLFRIEYDQHEKLAWSAIKYKDLEMAGAGLDEVHQVMDELLLNIPDTAAILILVETEPNKVTGLLKSLTGKDVLAWAEKLNGSGTNRAGSFELAMPLSEAIPKVLKIIKGETETEEDMIVTEEVPKEDPISQAIKSIDTEIEEKSQTEPTPEVDIEEAKTPDDPLKALGEILENYKPGEGTKDQPPEDKKDL